MLALGNLEKCSRCIQTDTPFTVGSHQKMTVSVRFWTTGPLGERTERIIDRCSTWAIKKHNLWAKYFTSWRHYGWRLDCKLSHSVKRTTQLPMNVRWIHVHVRGTWQPCHVGRLAFPLNISFYLIWRSKFRILRIKKTRTKIGTLRISHTSSRLDLGKTGAITDKVWWLSRTYKCSPRRGFRGVAFVCICILLSFCH